LVSIWGAGKEKGKKGWKLRGMLCGRNSREGGREGGRERRTVADLPPHNGLVDLVLTCLVDGVGALRAKNLGVGYGGRGRGGGREEGGRKGFGEYM